VEDKQASYAKPMVEIMSTNSLKRKPKTKKWIPAVTSALILIVLILGCYQKVNNSGSPYDLRRKKQSAEISQEDLNKFGSSVKVIDGQAESHYKMALHFQRRKKHKLAIEELKDAVKLNPLFVKAYNAMGVSYDNLRRYSQAIRCYHSALKLDPKLDYVHNNLGYSYLLKNELDAAIVAFQKAIELNDNNKRYRNNLGLAYIMKDQSDKAYEQFKIVEDEIRAKEKLARLLDKLGKEKPDQHLAKDSNSGGTRKKSERKTPVVIRRKIEANTNTPQSLIKAGISVQKPKDQEIKDEQFSLSDKKAFLNPDKDKAPLDETKPSTGYSRAALVKNQEIADPKKVKSLESIEKQAHRELQTESKQSDQPGPCEFCKEDTAKSDSTAIGGANPIQIPTMEISKPSRLSEKPVTEIKADIHEAKQSAVSSDPVYYLSAVEVVAEPDSEKNTSAESVKSKTSVYENANRVQSTIEPKVIEVEESYYPDAKETATVTPARSKKTKAAFIETNQTISEEKQPSVYAAATPIITSTDKKIDRKRIQDTRSQRKEALSLAAKEKDLKKNFKSEDTIVEVEIEIANGNGVNGAAGRFGRYLKSKGFKVPKVTNANSFDHATTKIFYCNGDIKNVYKLLQQIPFVPDQRSIIELKNMGSGIKIIIGKDLIKHDKTGAKTRGKLVGFYSAEDQEGVISHPKTHKF
jgi:Flp pilus assembly protein TadD